MTTKTKCASSFFLVLILATSTLTQSSTITSETTTDATTELANDEQIGLGIQLSPFSQLAHGLRSGPIIIVDKQTFYVPNLHYDGKGPDAHFWVGKGPEPSTAGILVPDEKGSNASLSAYTGQNVYIKLPNGLTIDQIDYFGLWCIAFTQNFGHVNIPKNIIMPEPTPDNDHEIVRLQKCCKLNEVLTAAGCTANAKKFEPAIDVHEHNDTHLDDEPIAAQSIRFEPFVNPIKCEFKKYPLVPEEDQFSLLKNGSLMVLRTKQILSQDEYCFETVDFGTEQANVWVTTAIVCMSNSDLPVSNVLFVIYAVGILVSAIFLILTALVFLMVRDVRDTRGKCVVGYSISMAVAFVCLATAQFFGLDNNTCNFVGFVFQFFLVSSFTWLTMVSWETYYKIRKYDSDEYTHDKKRLILYLCVGILTPLLILIVSLVVDQIPDIPNSFLKPQFGRNDCWFDQSGNSMLYFYIPIGVAILFNIVLAALMKWKLVWFEKYRSDDISWKAVKQDLKPMFRACIFLLSVMALCWIMEIISFITQGTGGIWTAIDIINSLQGLIIFVIFVLHRPVKDKICKKKRKEMRYNKPEAIHFHQQDRGDAADTSRDDFLTRLHQAESAEDLT